MSLIKRGNTWHIDFYSPDGKRVRQSAKTSDKQLAKELHDRLKAEYWRVQQVGDKPKMSWKEAVVRYFHESNNRSTKDDVSLFRILAPYLDSLYLNQIDDSVIRKIITGRKRNGVGNKTINNNLKRLQAVLNKAKDEWKVDVDPPKIKMLPTQRKRIRWITETEANRLLDACPTHTREMAAFTLETGLREKNVTHLRWEQVDLNRRVVFIESEDVLKDGGDFAVPLSDSAIEIIRRQIGQHQDRVFTFNGSPIKKAGSTAWDKAKLKAGITNFRWHDLRHTWASWHVMRGTPLNVLMELGNWKSYDMVLRYAHLNVDHLASHVMDTNWTQSQNLGKKKPVINLR